ncbi:hypothetical protein VTN00DRAFT_2825 [Thermoascus crustaceus]|uniref:uncharacterized protein n=1 Tax=Thermoascus crustaceus TaxID=5088 RepID=UPI0037442F4F
MTNVPAINTFIGRDSDVNQLWNILQTQASNMRKVAVLHGMGGIGKTQLAIHFARQHKDEFTAIFWVNGKDENILIRSLAAIAPRLRDRPIDVVTDMKNEEQLKQEAQEVLKWLSQEKNSNWLLIFDNIDQYAPGDNDVHGEGAYDIQKYFPSADHGSIIITTRLKRLAELATSSYLLQRLPLKKDSNFL